MRGGNCVEVSIGQVKLGRNRDMLQTTLGSCIGISFSWPKQSLYGLAHCLLPKSPKYCTSLGAKYVDQGINTLIRMMKISAEDFRQVEVYVAGGSQMFSRRSVSSAASIGLKNIESAKHSLLQHGFTIAKSVTGGRKGRRMYLDCENAKVTIRTIERSTLEK